jgi:hypothetical protein
MLERFLHRCSSLRVQPQAYYIHPLCPPCFPPCVPSAHAKHDRNRASQRVKSTLSCLPHDSQRMVPNLPSQNSVFSTQIFHFMLYCWHKDECAEFIDSFLGADEEAKSLVMLGHHLCRCFTASIINTPADAHSRALSSHGPTAVSAGTSAELPLLKPTNRRSQPHYLPREGRSCVSTRKYQLHKMQGRFLLLVPYLHRSICSMCGHQKARSIEVVSE